MEDSNFFHHQNSNVQTENSYERFKKAFYASRDSGYSPSFEIDENDNDDTDEYTW